MSWWTGPGGARDVVHGTLLRGERVTEVSDAKSPNPAGAMGWAGLTLAISKGSTVVATLVLARLLVPEDFGLFALGFLIINFVDRIKDFGVGAGLVYRREDWSRLAGTGLTLSLVSALFFAAVTFAGAPLVAHFFDDPRATGVLRALALVVLVAGLSIVPESKMRRELDFRRRLIPETGAALVKGSVSIGLAYAGMGVYALVWGQVLGSGVQSLLYWTLGRWRPRLGWHAQDARALLRYGVPSAMVAVLAILIENIDYAIIGRRLDTADLGYYVMAYRIPELSVLAVCIVAGQVLFPMFSRLQDDLPALRLSYLSNVRLISLITVPSGVLLACVADDLIITLYSERWQPAAPVLQVLALYSVVVALSFHAGEVYKATGRPGILNILAMVKLAALVPALYIASAHGIVAVAWALLGANLLLAGIELRVLQAILRLPARYLAQALWPAVASSAVLAVAVVTVTIWLDGLDSPVRLLVSVMCALAAYLATCHVVAPDALRRAVRLLKARATSPSGSGS